MQTRTDTVPMPYRIRGWKVIAAAIGVTKITAMKFAAPSERDERRLRVRYDHIGPYTCQAWIDDFIARHDQSFDEAKDDGDERIAS
jgi:hypothetical protein